MKFIQNIRPLLFGLLFFDVLASVAFTHASTLDEVQKRGLLQCGVSPAIPGFSSAQESGEWKGFEVALCRSVAAAVLGDPAKVRLVPLTDENGFIALQSGEVDLLASAAWSQSRDVALGLRYTEPVIGGEQGFLAQEDFKYGSALEGKGVTICTVEDSYYRKNIEEYQAKAQGAEDREVRILDFGDPGLASAAFSNSRCDLLFGFKPHLIGLSRNILALKGSRLLGDVVGRELRGMVVRQGDEGWYQIVRWVRYGLIMAEGLGVGKANIDKLLGEEDVPLVTLFLKNNLATTLGQNEDWLYQLISQMGNYGEIWEENLGAKTPLKLVRGVNSLWLEGGILYFPSVQD